MRLGEAWRVAVTALRANRLRSLLTMLGVIIGVASVVMLVAIGTGARQYIEGQVQGLGSNLLLVVPGEISFGSAPTTSRLTLRDVDEIGRIAGGRERVAATVTSGETLRAGNIELFATVQGTTETVPDVFVRPVARGEFLRKSDVDTRRRVVVLGASAADRLFGDREPVGRQVTIAGVRFRVVGVLAGTGSNSLAGADPDLTTYIPITAAQRLFGTERVDGLAVKAPDLATIDELGERIVADLEDRYPGERFSAVTQEQILGVVGRILSLLTLVLAAIAGISLLVGGVGITNIMLVSVRERTREIGLRKAVGARQRDVLVQFLLEAVLLTTIGGLIGIVIGVGVAEVVGRFSPLPTAVAWWSILLAFGVSVTVGVFFGVAPARSAGRLDPVVALRSE
ncbi:MAG: ABC-type antimicrobial peptide transport system, permease component [uncultured Corynebacteriales bacterium]|uniref:ABC-type antimicrobial peptide transport system, permease component n=1 Tax=uncultured Mycobacteriales bacterium TaxID=581187 RepID=A0A6J4IYB0_9ACTN|nr:MAG: ABC-type antimicrobial peptide transport system, permease component [uncultured Corynebacteriales bacterium]